MDNDVPYVPEEIVKGILKRLPVKSLIRFQCVCKHWKNLIKNPSFIADHLQQSSLQNPCLLLQCVDDYSTLRSCFRMLNCGLQLRELPKAPLIDSLWNGVFVGSCNGLFCVEGDVLKCPPRPLLLWNPATTEVRHVPLTTNDCFKLFDECVSAFGFSAIVNDYKIVRIYVKACDGVNGGEVFSLSKGSWKGIDIGNLKGVKLTSEVVSTNGAIFWFGFRPCRDKVIISFDMAKEMFTVMPWPDLGDHNLDENLTVYENKLAILCDVWNDDAEKPGSLDLWVLDEGTCAPGETWTWTKRSTSNPFSYILGRIIWRDEIVCRSALDKGRNVIYLMNLTTNEAKRFVIPYGGPIYGIFNYVESLVSVGDNH